MSFFIFLKGDIIEYCKIKTLYFFCTHKVFTIFVYINFKTDKL